MTAARDHDFMYNFAITGVAGYVAPRHLEAIRKTGNRLIAAADPHDSVGVLDRSFPDAAFFTEIERFDRFLEKLRHVEPSNPLHYLSICSPNHLHDAHVRLALRLDADAICEKPLVLKPSNLDYLQRLEEDRSGSVYTVLQLRVHPNLLALRAQLSEERSRRHSVRLTYVAPRGTWYRYSWKGDEEKSGGVVMNIGIHFFDVLMWLFGPAVRHRVHVREKTRAAGFVELRDADVQWFLSIEASDLPENARAGWQTFRSIEVDGRAIEFSGGFADLHTRVYEETLAGRGFRIDDARPSIELAYTIRQAPVLAAGPEAHPMAVVPSKP